MKSIYKGMKPKKRPAPPLESVTKAFVLFYLHSTLPEGTFIRFMKKTMSNKDMILAVKLFNSQEINFEELKEFILCSKGFTRMCSLINMTNKVVLNYLRNPNLSELRDMFKRATEVKTRLTLESIVMSTSQGLSKSLGEVIDLTMENDSSESSSSEDDEPFYSSPAPNKRLLHNPQQPSDIPSKKAKKDEAAEQSECVPLADNIEEEEELIPLRILKDVLERTLPRVLESSPQKEKEPSDRGGAIDYKKARCTWTSEEDKRLMSLVFSEDSFLRKWDKKCKAQDFIIYEKMFHRSFSSLYARWRLYIQPIIYLHNKGCDIPCWRLHFFKTLAQKGYKTIPWDELAESLPLDNIIMYKSLLKTMTTSSTNQYLPNVVQLGLKKWSKKLKDMEELKNFYKSSLVQASSQSSKDPPSLGTLSRSNQTSSIPISLREKDPSLSLPIPSTHNQKLSCNSPQITAHLTPIQNISFCNSPQDISANSSHVISSSPKKSLLNNPGDKWTLKEDGILLYAVLKAHSPRVNLKNMCIRTKHIQARLRKSFDSMINRWERVIKPSLLNNKWMKSWEINFLRFIERYEFFENIRWDDVLSCISEATREELQTYVQNHKNGRRVFFMIERRLNHILEESYTQKSDADVGASSPFHALPIAADTPFYFSDSKAIVDLVFLDYPNFDLQSGELKPSFFLGTFRSRTLMSVFMHWEKLVCINLFAARQENWKVSFLEYISHWALSSCRAVFDDIKVGKLYAHVPEDCRKSFLKTCIVFATSVKPHASFLSKVQLAYEYLRLKRGDLAQFDGILGYSLPLFSFGGSSKDKNWVSSYKARVSFTFPERLSILKRVIQAHPGEDVAGLCPSVEFFTRIAPEFDRVYISLKTHWERFIRLKLLLLNHRRLDENWELELSQYLLEENVQDRSSIDMERVSAAFPYLTSTAIYHTVVKVIKRTQIGRFPFRLKKYIQHLKTKNPKSKEQLWTPLLDFYKKSKANISRNVLF